MKKQQKREVKRAKREAKKTGQKEEKAKRKKDQQREKEARHQKQREAKTKPSTTIPVKKRKQHYVWRHYLDAWTTEGQLWCQMDGRRFQSGTNGVANSRDFYRLKEISPEDLAIVDLLVVQKSAPHLREIHHRWMLTFQSIFEMKRAYETSSKKNDEIEQRLDVTINNLEEDLHAHIEQQAIPLLKQLVDGKEIALKDPEKFAVLATFVAFQYMRTPKLMRASIEASTAVSELKFNIDAAWGLMRTMYATNIGAGIFQRHGTLRATFLESHPTVDFITSDQPTINVHARSRGPQESATDLVLYYPLSPRRALLLAFDAVATIVERRALSEAETHEYNRVLFEMSEMQIYGAREQELVSASRESQ